jgi:hypothetical protein
VYPRRGNDPLRSNRTRRDGRFRQLDERPHLDWGASGTLATVLNPAGFGTPFHDQDSGSVLIPLRVVTNGVFVFEKPGSTRTPQRGHLLLH